MKFLKMPWNLLKNPEIPYLVVMCYSSKLLEIFISKTFEIGRMHLTFFEIHILKSLEMFWNFLKTREIKCNPLRSIKNTKISRHFVTGNPFKSLKTFNIRRIFLNPFKSFAYFGNCLNSFVKFKQMQWNLSKSFHIFIN